MNWESVGAIAEVVGVIAIFILMLGGANGVSAEEVAANHSPFFDANEDALIGGVRKMVGLAMEYAESR